MRSWPKILQTLAIYPCDLSQALDGSIARSCQKRTGENCQGSQARTTSESFPQGPARGSGVGTDGTGGSMYVKPQYFQGCRSGA